MKMSSGIDKRATFVLINTAVAVAISIFKLISASTGIRLFSVHIVLNLGIGEKIKKRHLVFI